MQAHIAVRNLQGALITTLVHNLDTDDCEAATKQTLQSMNLELGLPADDWSCGTFHWGPLTGVWEVLQPGEEPENRDDEWASYVVRSVML